MHSLAKYKRPLVAAAIGALALWMATYQPSQSLHVASMATLALLAPRDCPSLNRRLLIATIAFFGALGLGSLVQLVAKSNVSYVVAIAALTGIATLGVRAQSRDLAPDKSENAASLVSLGIYAVVASVTFRTWNTTEIATVLSDLFRSGEDSSVSVGLLLDAGRSPVSSSIGVLTEPSLELIRSLTARHGMILFDSAVSTVHLCYTVIPMFGALVGGLIAADLVLSNHRTRCPPLLLLIVQVASFLITGISLQAILATGAVPAGLASISLLIALACMTRVPASPRTPGRNPERSGMPWTVLFVTFSLAAPAYYPPIAPISVGLLIVSLGNVSLFRRRFLPYRSFSPIGTTCLLLVSAAITTTAAVAYEAMANNDAFITRASYLFGPAGQTTERIACLAPITLAILPGIGLLSQRRATGYLLGFRGSRMGTRQFDLWAAFATSAVAISTYSLLAGGGLNYAAQKFLSITAIAYLPIAVGTLGRLFLPRGSPFVETRSIPAADKNAPEFAIKYSGSVIRAYSYVVILIPVALTISFVAYQAPPSPKLPLSKISGDSLDPVALQVSEIIRVTHGQPVACAANTTNWKVARVAYYCNRFTLAQMPTQYRDVWRQFYVTAYANYGDAVTSESGNTATLCHANSATSLPTAGPESTRWTLLVLKIPETPFSDPRKLAANIPCALVQGLGYPRLKMKVVNPDHTPTSWQFSPPCAGANFTLLIPYFRQIDLCFPA